MQPSRPIIKPDRSVLQNRVYCIKHQVRDVDTWNVSKLWRFSKVYIYLQTYANFSFYYLWQMIDNCRPYVVRRQLNSDKVCDTATCFVPLFGAWWCTRSSLAKVQNDWNFNKLNNSIFEKKVLHGSFIVRYLLTPKFLGYITAPYELDPSSALGILNDYALHIGWNAPAGIDMERNYVVVTLCRPIQIHARAHSLIPP